MMKKVNVKVFACLMAGALMMNSCIGSFSLFNKYAEWQRTMTNSKFLNAIVGFILMPIVGSITLVIDWFVLNTIEFWSGDNPMAKNAGKTQQVMGSDGRYYAVKTLIAVMVAASCAGYAVLPSLQPTTPLATAVP
jgi:hypothetical protein